MGIKFSNNASGTLASSINATATTIVLSSGQGALFPSLGAGDYFYATLVNASNNLEIVKVTARSTDSLTVVRGQDGTSGRSYSAGDRLELRPVAGCLTDIVSSIPRSGNAAVARLVTDQVSVTSTTWTSVGDTVSITPSSTSAKILITLTIAAYIGSPTNFGFLDIRRGSTQNLSGQAGGLAFANTGTQATSTISWVDSPNTTSPVTYGLSARVNQAGASMVVGALGSVMYYAITAVEV